MLKCQQKKLPRQGAVKKIGTRDVCSKTAAGREEYNRRKEQMRIRQHYLCAMCREPLSIHHSTFDHESGRGMSGSIRTDAIVDDMGYWINAALHIWCNVRKGSKRYKWQNGFYKPVEKFKEKAA